MPKIDLSMLNQRQTPAFYADVLANRPAAGFIGRIFVSTNTYAFYRDNGTSWDLIGGPGTGTVTGSGTAGQVTYWDGASSITGSNNLFWDSANNRLGINNTTPGASLDIHSAVSSIAQFNQTTATNNSLLVLQNSGSALWRLGNYYNAGANDFGVFDVVGAIQPLTIKKTTGQVLIGTSTVGSGKLVVASATGDNGIQIVGATAPSLRIDSAESGPTKRAGFGISTATNNFIQGSADRDFCMFNGSTTASPILFGIYDAGAVNVQEAARISAARNFLIGTTTDGGQRLQISGSARATSYYLDGMTAGSGALYWTSNRVTLANYNAGGSVLLEVNGGVNGLLIGSDLSATFYSKVFGVTSGLSSGFNTGAFIAKSSGNDFRYTQIGYDNSGNYGWIQALEQGTAYTNLVLNAAGGNVLIGTTSAPSSIAVNDLLVIGKSGSASNAINFSNGSTTNWGYLLAESVKMVLGSGSSSNITFETNGGSERMRIAASTGNLLVGTTTDVGVKLNVDGSIRSTTNFILTGATGEFLANGSGSSNSVGGSSRFTIVDSSNGRGWILQQNASYDLDLWHNNSGWSNVGRFNNATGVYTALSDKNKKKNFETSNLGLEAVLKLKPTLYNIISQSDNEEKELGFIAQEVKEVIKQAYVENGEFIGLNYQPIVATLVKAIQELNTKIENLK